MPLTPMVFVWPAPVVTVVSEQPFELLLAPPTPVPPVPALDLPPVCAKDPPLDLELGILKQVINAPDYQAAIGLLSVPRLDSKFPA